MEIVMKTLNFDEDKLKEGLIPNWFKNESLQ